MQKDLKTWHFGFLSFVSTSNEISDVKSNFTEQGFDSFKTVVGNVRFDKKKYDHVNKILRNLKNII